MVDDFLVEKLIEERIARKDCRMQGFVLEGYPKNQQQFDNLRNMKLAPTMVVAIDAPLQLLSGRTQDPDALKHRYEKWSSFASYLRNSKEKVFWANPQLNVGNLYEDVVHEFEKRFI
jgi:adenylate kinase